MCNTSPRLLFCICLGLQMYFMIMQSIFKMSKCVRNMSRGFHSVESQMLSGGVSALLWIKSRSTLLSHIKSPAETGLIFFHPPVNGIDSGACQFFKWPVAVELFFSHCFWISKSWECQLMSVQEWQAECRWCHNDPECQFLFPVSAMSSLTISYWHDEKCTLIIYRIIVSIFGYLICVQ